MAEPRNAVWFCGSLATILCAGAILGSVACISERVEEAIEVPGVQPAQEKSAFLRRFLTKSLYDDMRSHVRAKVPELTEADASTLSLSYREVRGSSGKAGTAYVIVGIAISRSVNDPDHVIGVCRDFIVSRMAEARAKEAKILR